MLCSKSSQNDINYLDEYLDELRSKGRYVFTLEELEENFNVSDEALNQNLARLEETRDKKKDSHPTGS